MMGFAMMAWKLAQKRSNWVLNDWIVPTREKAKWEGTPSNEYYRIVDKARHELWMREVHIRLWGGTVKL